jgi:hypothetical protein
MKRVLFTPLILAAIGCGSSGSTAPPSIYNSWVFATGTQTATLTIKSDGTYTSQLDSSVSPSKIDEGLTTGDVDVTDSTVTFTPKKWTCPGPAGGGTAMYSLGTKTLELIEATGTTTYQLGSGAQSTAVQTVYGCYINGAFTPHALGMGEP